MVSIAPAANVTAGAFGGFVAVMVLHICAANNINIPPDVSDALPYAFAMAITHIWDCFTGDNKPNAPK